MSIGIKIYQLRKERGISQEELAGQLTISRQAISRWELDESVPDTENVVQLSRIFGVSTDYLLIDEYEDDNDIPAVRVSSERLKMKFRVRARIASFCILCIGLLLGLIGWFVHDGYVTLATNRDESFIPPSAITITYVTTFYYILSGLFLVVGIFLLLYSLNVFKNWRK